jgi:hypothetical protein
LGGGAQSKMDEIGVNSVGDQEVPASLQTLFILLLLIFTCKMVLLKIMLPISVIMLMILNSSGII